MARKIVITSGKGGVGKTTVVSNLGIALAKNKSKVMMVDMDFGLNNLDVLMGIENKIVYDVIDVLEGRCSPKQALIQDFFESNLYILPSMHSYCSIKFGVNELLYIINQLEGYFDYILIDCPAGIDGGFRRAVGCANEYIVITTPHLSAVRDADKVLSFINMNYGKVPYLIINRARGDLMLDGQMLSVNAIKEYLPAELIGVIPEDDEMSKQLVMGGQISKYSDAYKSINLVAKNLNTEGVEIFDCTAKYRGMIGNIRKKIKRRL